MKWVMGIVALLALIMAACWWWVGKDLKPLTDEARVRAPGQFISLSAGQIHYRWRGRQDGPVIVMAHGFSTPQFIFEQNAEALVVAGYHVLQFDHFGRGWSDRPKEKYDIEFYDRQLIELFDGLSLKEPVGLVGLSMGGAITAEFTARHPERVSRLFLFVPAGLDLGGTDNVTDAILRVPLLGDWFWRMFARAGILAADETVLKPAHQLQGDVSVQMDYRGYFSALLSTLRHFPMRERDETYLRLQETGVPVMAIFGTADVIVLASSAERLEKLLPTATIHVVEGASHELNHQNYDIVNPWLVDWFGLVE